MIRPSAAVLCLSALAGLYAEDAPKERGMFDLLGGATWSERHGEAIVGWSSLEIDGVPDDQNAWYLSAAASAISGYQVKDKPFGTILGLGAGLKTWWGDDDVKIRSVVPFVYGIGGFYSHFSERTRTELVGRVGPGVGFSKVGNESSTDFAWTWAVEGALSVTKGESAGLGVGVGYEAIHVGDWSQEGPYIMIRIGF